MRYAQIEIRLHREYNFYYFSIIYKFPIPTNVFQGIIPSMKINISKRITNDRMLKTLRLLRLAGERIPSVLGNRIVREHFDLNVQSFENHRGKIAADGGFIENQNEFTDMYYGSASVRHSGCEVIAVYNIMRALTDKEPSLPKLIAAFEKNGMIFYGSLGTDPGEMKYFLRKQGFLVEEYTRNEDFPRLLQDSGFEGEWRLKRFHRVIPENEAFVLTFYNDRSDILQGLHTAAVTSNGRGLYLHNDGGTRARGPYPGLSWVLNEYEHRGAGMISIIHVRSERR